MKNVSWIRKRDRGDQGDTGVKPKNLGESNQIKAVREGARPEAYAVAEAMADKLGGKGALGRVRGNGHEGLLDASLLKSSALSILQKKKINDAH